MTNNSTKTALVTGASRGLGLALSRALAQRGWKLLIDARGAEALEAARSELADLTQVIALAGDVADEQHRLELAAAAELYGGLDLLVNNAGALGPSPLPELLDFPATELLQLYATNVVAPLALAQSVRQLAKRDFRLLNISSDAAVETYEGWGGYGSSKAALEHGTRVLALENPQWKVYIVDPGDMRTDMHQRAFPGENIDDRPLPEESVPGLLALVDGLYISGRYRARALSAKADAA